MMSEFSRGNVNSACQFDGMEVKVTRVKNETASKILYIQQTPKELRNDMRA